LTLGHYLRALNKHRHGLPPSSPYFPYILGDVGCGGKKPGSETRASRLPAQADPNRVLGRDVDLITYGGLKPIIDDDVKRDAVLL
jgi:hypothetical protein